MAITKVGAMTDPPVAGDYTILQAKLDAYAKQIGNQGMILTEWVNTTTTPAIALGSYIVHGGTLFIVDTEDFAVPAPAGDGTYYLKVATSGATLAISWVASTAGYAWNSIYNGLYHADESQILPYQLVKAGATLTKRKITNLMQGSGFVTVDWTGAVQSVYFNQGVKTTDSPTFATVNTGQGANELYAMNQNVRTTDSPTFATVNATDVVTTNGPNKPVDNNDSSLPAIGVGGFTFGVSSHAGTITLPSGGTYVVVNSSIGSDGSSNQDRTTTQRLSGGTVVGYNSYAGSVGTFYLLVMRIA